MVLRQPVGAQADKRGYVTLANNNLTYPAIATIQRPRGGGIHRRRRGDYPSAGYAATTPRSARGPAPRRAGLGPGDGITGYNFYAATAPR